MIYALFIMAYVFCFLVSIQGCDFMESAEQDLKGLRVEVGRQMFMMRGVWCVVVAVQ